MSVSFPSLHMIDWWRCLEHVPTWRSRHDQHAALDLILVRMPELPLLLWKRLVDPRRYHVLDPDQSRVGIGRVVDQTLAEICAQQSASSFRFTCLLHEPSVICEQ